MLAPTVARRQRSMATQTGLCGRLVALLEKLGAIHGAAEAAADLLARYAEPHRVYHGPNHIAACLRELDLTRVGCPSPDLAELALWYHDGVHHSRRHDNEARSANLLRRHGRRLGLPDETCRVAARIVRTTRTHCPTDDPTTNLAIDIDLSILGARDAAYRAYVTGVRAEYRHVPRRLFDLGRARLIRRWLAAPSIYTTPVYRHRLEAAARANLASELTRLRSTSSALAHP